MIPDLVDLEQPLFLDKQALLDGGDVLPGFKIALANVFEQNTAAKN